MPAVLTAMPSAASGDMQLVRRALARDGDAFRTIIKTHNQRLYRIARGVVRNDSEAEDIVQEAYVRAFTHLDGFRGDSTLATWLSRIVINEALGRLRKKRRARSRLSAEIRPSRPRSSSFPCNASNDDPERTMAQRQILQLVERATDNLPDVYRTVFVARVIEGLSIEETAELLGVRARDGQDAAAPRPRAGAQGSWTTQIGPVLLDAFPFAGRRCERLTSAVMKRLGLQSWPSAADFAGNVLPPPASNDRQPKTSPARFRVRAKEVAMHIRSHRGTGRAAARLASRRSRKPPTSRPIRRSPTSPTRPASSTSKRPSWRSRNRRTRTSSTSPTTWCATTRR